MINSDELLTLAELAIALGGFTAVVVVLRRDTHEQIDPFRLFSLVRGVLEHCLAIIVFCLLPLVLAKFEVEDLWAWSSWFYAGTLALYLILFLVLYSFARIQHRVTGDKSTLSKEIRGVATMPVVLVVLVGFVFSSTAALMLLNTLNTFASIDGVYLAALVVHFSFIFVSFIVLLWGVVEGSQRST